MKKITTLYQVAVAVILFVVFLMGTASAQLSSKYSLRAPFIFNANSQLNSKSIIENAEKDIVFIENPGQIRDSKGNERPDVLFFTRSQGVDMYITKSGLTYVFRKIEGDPKADNLKTSCCLLDMEFIGAKENLKVKKELAVEQKFNYYKPEYPNGIFPKGYKKVTIENLYEGIDLVYYEKEGKMKYDFIVKAGADPNKIKMKYKGAEIAYIDKNGSVVITTPMGEISEEKPYTYSKSTGLEIEGRYKVNENVVQFDIAEYNKSEDIIIDPYRIWATYYGGSSSDIGYSICTDNFGNLYVAGYTSSYNFPIKTLPGAYNQSVLDGVSDIFILKFDITGARIWATYYGGSSYDIARSICTDISGNLYVSGYTRSSNFPTQTLMGAYNQTTLNGYSDAFILKFSNSGARLWATYYGGSSYEYGYSVCTDNSNNLCVTGYTRSSNFPTKTLTGAYNQTTLVGSSDAFIIKFSNYGTRIWATYYGGSSYEYGYSICADNSGNLYVTGYSTSSNFPTKALAGAYNQMTLNGGGDAFILRFNSSSARQWATFYGGSSYEYGYGIYTNNSDNLYVTGYTRSSNFPLQTLAGAYNQNYPGSYANAFILKFSISGARVWATYYGGNNYDYGYYICTDNSGNLYVIGYTRSSNFPTQTLTGAYNQTTLGGSSDAFILKFNNNSARIWATYYGGSNYEYGYSIDTDNSDYLYTTGYTRSTDFPLQVLPEAYNQATSGGGSDVFILMFSPTLVEIKKISNEIPVKYSLYQNYPNPFNPTTNIRFDLYKLSQTKLILYDMIGKEVAVLVDEKLNAGSYEVDWDASGYPSGVYFYKLIADDFVDVKKMLLIK